ncbi:MAG: hypothetical protein ACXVHL_35870 [Solirubrobacteraceae bacterium]
MEGLDLSALFGPPTVVLTKAQYDAIGEHFLGDEGNIGVMIRNYGGGTANAIALTGSIPGFETGDEEIVLDVAGTVYDATDDPEAALEAAEAANEPILAAYEAGKNGEKIEVA